MKSHSRIFLFIILDMFKDHEYVKLNSVNPLYLIINKINRYFEKVSGNKYLTVVPNNESKEIIIKKHEELWGKIKYQTRTTINN